MQYIIPYSYIKRTEIFGFPCHCRVYDPIDHSAAVPHPLGPGNLLSERYPVNYLFFSDREYGNGFPLTWNMSDQRLYFSLSIILMTLHWTTLQITSCR